MPTFKVLIGQYWSLLGGSVVAMGGIEPPTPAL